MSPLPHLWQREALIATARRLNPSGLNQGTSGNLSHRVDEGFLVTPTGMEYEALRPEDIVLMRMDGSSAGGSEAGRLPSSEWRFHRDILASRPEVQAVLHTHSLHSTALSCLRRGIPPFHYMVAMSGGSDIRCAPYATFGTEELSRHAVAALEGRKACLLANHGLIAVGADLAGAFKLAVEVETLAAMYLRALSVGEPVLLEEADMAEVLEKFRTYGQQR